jgi:hypothetical protein
MAPIASPAEDQASQGKATRSRKPERPAYRVPWAELLKKVFAVEVLSCPECSGRMERIAFIAEGAIARGILEHLGLETTGPPLGRATGTIEGIDPAPEDEVADPEYSDC